jgi:hypothetical protein
MDNELSTSNNQIIKKSTLHCQWRWTIYYFRVDDANRQTMGASGFYTHRISGDVYSVTYPSVFGRAVYSWGGQKTKG